MSKSSSSSLVVLCLTFSLAPIAFADEPATPGQGTNTSQAPAAQVAPTPATAPASTSTSSGDSTMTPASSEPAAPAQEAASAHPNATSAPAESSAGSASPRQADEEAGRAKPAQPTSAPATQSAEDRIICKRIEVTGTRLRKGKVCKPLSEWRAAEAAAKGLLNDANRRGAPQPGGETLPTG